MLGGLLCDWTTSYKGAEIIALGDSVPVLASIEWVKGKAGGHLQGRVMDKTWWLTSKLTGTIARGAARQGCCMQVESGAWQQDRHRQSVQVAKRRLLDALPVTQRTVDVKE